MKVITLMPIKEWEEKDGEKITGRIRLYVGNLHVGTCTPKKPHPDKMQQYSFRSMYYGEGLDISVSSATLEEIKSEVEIELKSFIGKVTQSVRTFVAASDVKKSPPQHRPIFPDRKDGNGKR